MMRRICLPVMLVLILQTLHKLDAADDNQQPRDASINRQPNSNLYYSKECRDDIDRHCLNSRKLVLTDLAVLQCIHNEVPDLNLIDKECHNLLFEFKKNLTTNLRLDNSALQICRDDLPKLKECETVDKVEGHLVSCLLDNKESVVTENCRTFLNNIASFVFSDYRLIYNFISDCQSDIKRFSCGRLEKDTDNKPTQQGKTIECLSLHYVELDTNCRKQITRVVELQSDDFHLDRTLYFACRDDRERLCPNVQSGNGMVYKCLIRNKFDRLMSKECREQLTRRQKVIVEDAFADRTLIRACKQDILQNKCRKELRNDYANPIKLAGLILCLEGALRDGQKLSESCELELVEHRKILMSDYQLNPNLVKFCSSEITNYCGGGIERDGKTLHCLLNKVKHAFNNSTFTFTVECINELRNLIKIVDASEDVRVDPNLQEACQSILKGTCRDVKPGKGRVIECLLNQLNKPEMTEDCEERLLEIQYFVSRDWKLTPKLYRNCKEDAINLCHAKHDWNDQSTDVDNSPLILPCLFHFLNDDDDNDDDEDNRNAQNKLSPKCKAEIRSVMLIRAKSFDLIPEVQEECYVDLGKYCSDENVDIKGGEMRCLQRNLKLLASDCKEAVMKYTASESQDLRLDQILMKACMPIINEKCGDKKDGKGDLLECLIQQKNDQNMDEKCRMGIEHHQLLNMQDVSFNPKFRKSCRREIMEHCSNAKTKIDIIRCLSDIVLNDTLLDQMQRIGDTCRSKLRFELLQLNANIKLDPELENDCKEDISRLCDDVKSGQGEVLECLRSKLIKLSETCKQKLIKRDKIAFVDQKADYELQAKCKNAIMQYCNPDVNEDLIGCLRKHLLKTDLEPSCRKIVINRIMTQNLDARFNPTLWAACQDDVKVNCKNDFIYTQDTNEILNGRVLKCLKSMFVANRLSKKCELEVDQVMREAARVDYRLDPLLVDGCLHQIEELCSVEPNDKKEDCLRLEFQRGNIPRGSKCFEEVRRIIIEGAADVFIDHELSEVCAIDLNRYCNEIPPGGSQQLKCLLGIQNSDKKLNAACNEKISSRQQLWKLAEVSDGLTGLNDLAQIISKSEHRSYLLFTLFLIFSLVFVLGCFCRPVVFRRRSDKLK